MSKEAMKLALEALKEYCEHGAIFMPFTAVKALEEALAKQEQGEPVACDNCKKLEDELEHLRIKAELWKRDAIVWKSAYDVEVGFREQEQGEPVAWRYKPVREDNPRWEYTTQHPLDMGDGYLRPSLVEYCKCIEPLYATEKPKLMLEKFREMKDLLDEPKQEQGEPVAWANPNDLKNFDMKVRTNGGPLHTVPLYTTPQQRTWVGLTQRDIDWCIADAEDDKVLLVLNVQRILKEKNT